MLDREQALSANDLGLKPISLPEWGEQASAFTRNWDGWALAQWQKAALATPDGERIDNAEARIVCLSLCDETGRLIFNYPDDVEPVSKKSGRVIERIFLQAWAQNKPEGEAEAEKKSETTADTGSG